MTSLVNRGFTLIELLVVFAILATLSVISLAAFSSYNTSQQLDSARLDIKNAIDYAKSQAVSQVDTCNAGDQFLGYTFTACCTGGSCPSCLPNNSYRVDEVCSSGSKFIKSQKLSANVLIDVTNSTAFIFQFNPLSGNLVGSGGTLQIKNGSATKTIKVSATGIIQ